MKKYMKWPLVLLAALCFLQASAQRGRYDRRYADRYVYHYNYHYNNHYNSFYRAPYRYSPVRASVSIIARLPFGAVALTLGGRHYHYYNGIYYSPVPTGYMIVAPPPGIIVPMLPPGCLPVVVGGRSYYRYDDVYYSPMGDSRYQVIEKPAEEEEVQTQKAVASSSTDSYEKFVLEGKTYYKKGGKYYKARVSDGGEILYEEVGEAAK